MNTELPKKLQIWETQRRKGPLRYVLIKSSLVFGLGMCMWMTLIDYFKGEAITLDSILEHAFLGALLGFIGGAITWARSENSYREYLKKQNMKTSRTSG